MKKAVWGWALYDFGNSAFTTLIVTFIYSYFFAQEIAPDGDTGTIMWANGIAVTALVVALTSPFLGALADRGGHRRRFLMITTGVAITGCALLYFPTPGQVTFALAVFVVSNIAFELCGVFYNSYLPDLADSESIGKVSGYGWALGYLGGLLAMAVALVGFVQPEIPLFGLATGEEGLFQNVRATTVLVAVWFAVFAIPMFRWVPERAHPDAPPLGELLRDTVTQLAGTFREIRRYGQIVRLLVARMIYNDGSVTIFAFGGIYAVGTFDFSIEKIMIFGIVLNVAAGIGAFFMGYMDDRLGGKKTILVATAGLVLATVIAALTTSEAVFWGAGILIGLMAGPNQAASRSLMTRFTPPEMKGQFFGFYAFSGKATAFVGPLALGVLTQQFNSQRAGIWVVALLFVVGGLLLWAVDEKQGIAAVQGPQQK